MSGGALREAVREMAANFSAGFRHLSEGWIAGADNDVVLVAFEAYLADATDPAFGDSQRNGAPGFKEFRGFHGIYRDMYQSTCQ